MGASRRALVLGGGGITGIAWETGTATSTAASAPLPMPTLAAGCDRVVVLAPVNFALRRSRRIDNQLASLGPSVRSIVVSPDAQSRRAIGSNVLDPAHRDASARAGRVQAASVLDAVAAVWSA